MIIFAKWYGVETIFAPRSGFILSDIEKSARFKRRAAYILNKSDKILCQGSFWKEFFIDTFEIDEKKLIVINNCIDHTKFHPKDNFNSDPVSVLFMGWIEKNKGVFELVKAIEILKDENLIWNIAGEGMALEEIKAQIAVLNLESKVNFLGWIHGEEKLKHLEEADIFVLSSYREGMPNSLMEAMASRTAVVSTSVGAVPDLVLHGENGYLVEPGTYEPIAKHVKNLALNKELRKKMSEAAYNTIGERFSVEAIIPKFEKLLLN
jgi:glycosyltransferase involved in cell wall biosynthesis